MIGQFDLGNDRDSTSVHAGESEHVEVEFGKAYSLHYR